MIRARFLHVVPACMAAVFLLLPALATADPIWVTDLADDLDFNNGTCTLREAILSAENGTSTDACDAGTTGSDEIYFAVSGVISLVDGLPDIETSVRILGPGVTFLTVNANGLDRVFNFEPEATNQVYELRGMTITGGLAPNFQDGGGVYLDSGTFTTTLTVADCLIFGNTADSGGGVASTGDLTLQRVTVRDNVAESLARGGGGVYSVTGTLTIIGSTISENLSESTGGGLDASSDTFIIRSTFSQNTADGAGGAIYYSSPPSAAGTLTLRHSTITQNWANGSFSGSSNTGGGLRLANGGFFTENTILAANLRYGASATSTASDDIDRTTAGTTVTTGGHNLIGNNTTVTGTFPVGTPNGNDDRVGSVSTPLLPMLNALLNNSGPTKTHQPNPGSPAIDNGSCALERYDQRGFAGNTSLPRRAAGPCDIGAVETDADPLGLELRLGLILTGAWDPDAEEMRTDLAETGAFPTIQPYFTAPWDAFSSATHSADKDEDVDWVLVRFYTGGHLNPTGLSLAGTQVMVLRRDADIVDPDVPGTLQLLRPGVYYMSVEHRNHAPELSMPLVLEWTGSEGFGFFETNERPYWVDPPVELPDGLFGSLPADPDQDGLVTPLDVTNFWVPTSKDPKRYEAGDFNMNAQVDEADIVLPWVEWHGVMPGGQ